MQCQANNINMYLQLVHSGDKAADGCSYLLHPPVRFLYITNIKQIVIAYPYY